MLAQPNLQRQVDITDAFVRMYVFLAQHMDRCMSEAARINYPESELRSQLASATSTMMEVLSVNDVVKGKVERECRRVRSLTTAYQAGGGGQPEALRHLKAERVRVKYKLVALTDLLAVLRAA